MNIMCLLHINPNALNRTIINLRDYTSMLQFKLPFLLTILLLLSMASACTTYYKTSHINKNADKLTRNTNQNTTKVTNDYQDLLQMQKELLKHTNISTEYPYTSIDKMLQQLEKHILEVKKSEKSILNNRQVLSAFLKGKKKIRSDSPDLDKFNSIIKNQKILYEEHSERLMVYREDRDKLVSLLDSNKITKLKLSETRKKVKTFTDDAANTIIEIDTTLAQEKEKYLTYNNQKFEKDKIEYINNTLKEIESVISKIEIENKQLIDLVDGFKSEINDRNEIWVGPGMKTHTLLMDMSEIGKIMNNLSNNYNHLIDKLNNL